MTGYHGHIYLQGKLGFKEDLLAAIYQQVKIYNVIA